MPISIPAFLPYLLLLASLAQTVIIVPNCTVSTLDWSFNSLQQSPCFVAASLEAVCFGSFALATLSPGQTYTGPNETVADGDLCNCNTVLYSVISACAACQQGGWPPYSTWLANCTTSTTGVFPLPFPDSIRVPHWAYLTSFTAEPDDSWNITAAEAAGDNPETTGIPQPTLLPTVSGSSSAFPLTALQSGSPSTLLPTATQSGSSSTSHTSSNRGAMAGGIVGGIVGATLISGFLTWYIVRRRHTRRALSIRDTRGDMMAQPVPHPRTINSSQLYNPLDPTTYPRIQHAPLSNQRPARYSGLPEAVI